MKYSKYNSKIKSLTKKKLFTSAESRAIGLPSRMLAYFCKIGIIERISRGLYKIKNYNIDIDFEWEDLALVAKSIPNGVICLISALCYYNLTDQIMREFWIAIPHSSTSPKRPNAHIVRMRNITLGKTQIKMGTINLKIFDRERTIIDSFRYLSEEIAIKALKAYLNSKEKPNLKKLLKYAKILRVDIKPYILAYTT